MKISEYLEQTGKSSMEHVTFADLVAIDEPKAKPEADGTDAPPVTRTSAKKRR